MKPQTLIAVVLTGAFRITHAQDGAEAASAGNAVPAGGSGVGSGMMGSQNAGPAAQAGAGSSVDTDSARYGSADGHGKGQGKAIGLKKKPDATLAVLPVLVDVTGNLVGPYLPVAGSVILRVQGAIIAAGVTNQIDVAAPYGSLGQQSGSTYRWVVQDQTWFLSADCSGPPIPLALGGLRPVAYTQEATTGKLTAYIGGSGRSTAKPANSVRQPSLGQGPQGGQCLQKTPFGGVIQGFDVEQTVVISQRFPEPLTLR